MAINPLAFLQQLGQGSPYPQNPLIALLQGLAGAQMYRRQETERQKELTQQQQLFEMQRKQFEQSQLTAEYNRLLGLAGGDVRRALQNPRFRQVAQALGIPVEQGPAIAPPQGAFGQSQAGGEAGAAQLGTTGAQTYAIPGLAPEPAVRTLGDLAKLLGLNLKSPAHAQVGLDQLPEGFDLRQLFADPNDARNKARARIQELSDMKYTPQQIFQHVGAEVWTLAGLPMTTAPGTQALTIGRTGAFGSEALRAQAGQTVQVPTGQTVPTPLLPPGAAPERVALFNNQTGAITVVELPPGSRLVPFTPPGQPTRHAVVDRNGNVIQVLPPGVQPHFQPQPAAAGTSVGAPITRGVGRTPGTVFGNWEILPPKTKAGESRYRNRRTGQVLSRAGALQVFKQTNDADLAQALGVPRGKISVKPPLPRSQMWAELQQIKAQIAILEKLPEELPVAQRLKFQQQYAALIQRGSYLMSLLGPRGR